MMKRTCPLRAPLGVACATPPSGLLVRRWTSERRCRRNPKRRKRKYGMGNHSSILFCLAIRKRVSDERMRQTADLLSIFSLPSTSVNSPLPSFFCSSTLPPSPCLAHALDSSATLFEMRRFAALFKRNDKSDPRIAPSASDDARSNPPSKSTTLKKRSLFFRSLSAKAVQPPVIREPTHPVPQRPPQAHSSSSSSTDSPAPATPDDDSEIGPGPPYRRSNQWSERKLALPLPAAGGSLGWDPPRSRSLGIPQIPSIARSSESDDLDDESSATSSSPSVPSPLSISPHTSLYTFTTYALAPTFSAPPLLYLPDIPLFPRSVNSVSSLSHQDTMASTLHRNQILRRLARRDLTASEERSVASFTSPRPLPAKSPFFLSKFDGGPTCNVRRVSNVSQGLKRWVSRPCFEDRMSVYTLGPSGRPDDIVVHNVSGSALGVEALEVSEAIDVLAGYNVEERSETLWLPMLSSPSTTDLRLSAPGKRHN